MYNEKKFQVEFGRNNLIDGFFELKISKGKSIRFDAVKEHQKEALLAVNSSKGLYHKITDNPVSWGMDTKMRFTKSKPFDCFRVSKQDAYVVVMFYTPRQRKNVYYIRIRDWLEAEAKMMYEKKSITEEELKLRACVVENYLKKV